MKQITTIWPLKAIPNAATTRGGFVKVRLSYLTPKPKHLRSVVLGEEYKINPPYTEEVCILMPQSKVFTLLETYLPAFDYLQSCGLVPEQSQLQDTKVLDEDSTTLSYIFEK
jgi:hypothetical protein